MEELFAVGAIDRDPVTAIENPRAELISVAFTSALIGLLSLGTSSVTAGEAAKATEAKFRGYKSLWVQLVDPASPLTERIRSVLVNRIQERCEVEFTALDRAECVISLAVRPGIGLEGFRIGDRAQGGVEIAGNDTRGLLFGVGKFLRSSEYGADEFLPSTWRGSSVPDKPVRGVYFATHFFNWYHVAPVEEVTRYVEDMSLWGINSFLVWFAVDAYNGIDDPNAQVMLARLRVLLKTVKDLGLDTSLGCVANDGYANSPVELRAERVTERGQALAAWMGTELCPSKRGVLELELKYCEEKFAAFESIGLDYWFIWPYDNGGCACSECAPYGANGYLTMAEPIARAYRRAFPKGKVILGAWFFDHWVDGEWEGITKKFNAERPDWVDYIMADGGGGAYPEYPLEHGSPGGLPMLNFPEISMYGMAPWGGYGANPMPGHLQELWNSSGDRLSGGFPYSEGIYEDINKAILAQFYWRQKSKAVETVREYISFYYSPAVVEEVSRAIGILAQNGFHRREEKDGATRILMTSTEGADEAFRLIAQSDKRLTPRVRASWRWRILYLRALIDSELSRHQLRVSERCNTAFKELRQLYHSTEQTGDYITAPRNIIGIVSEKNE